MSGKMQLPVFIAITAIFLLSGIIASLQSSEEQHENLLLKRRDISISPTQLETLLAKPKNQLNVQTSCSKIHLSDYEGAVRSGFLNVGIKNSTSALGFIFYGAQGVKEQDLYDVPTIIWLNGGPGCTSQQGNFFEIGPFKLHMNTSKTKNPHSTTSNINDEKDMFSFTKNEFSWTKNYNVLFVDQPIGTGISFAEKDQEIPVNQDQIAEQFYYALSELYANDEGCFSQLDFGRHGKTLPPLFILGESYAGKYIPSIAQKILQEGNKYNLQSISIGDAFISPELILQTITEYALKHNIIDESMLSQSLQAAQDILDAMNDPSREREARSLFWRFLQITNPQNVDVYNISRSSNEKSDAITLETFLNAENQGIRAIFNLAMYPNADKMYTRCDKRVQGAMANDFMRGDCLKRFTYLLNQGLEIIVYNGDLDMLVPDSAPELWIKTLSEWPYTEQFISSYSIEWKKGSSVFGSFKTFQNLSLYQFKNSGHMVPSDQPEAAYNFINRIVQKVHRNQKDEQYQNK